MPGQTPATELRTAALALRDPDAEACQQPDCGCPEELHRRDTDGLSWCTDCQEQHPYRPAPAYDVPERLRGPLARWLEAVASEMEGVAGTEYEFGEFASWDAALAVARTVLGEVTQ